MSRCMRCGAGNEWIEGSAKRSESDRVAKLESRLAAHLIKIAELAELAELKEGLRKYGGHTGDCGLPGMKECVCGYDALLNGEKGGK